VSVLPLVTVVALLAGLVAAVVLLLRTGEIRAGVLAAVLALLVVHPALTLWQEPARPLGLDAATTADGAYLLASLLCLFVVVALWRTLSERDRIESLHWDAMEGVRALGDLGGSRSADFDASLSRLLEIGCSCFGVEVGVASRVRGKRYEVIAIRAPESFPVSKGSVFPLEETCCAVALGAERPVALSGPGVRPAPNAFRFQAYLGTEIPLADGFYGTLCFASLAPRKAAFTATDKDLLRVMAQWLGRELERRERGRAPARRLARSGGSERSGPARRREIPAPRSVDLNDVLGRVKRQLELTAGPRIELDLRAAPDLRAAQDHHLPLDAIVLSLVRNAVDAMPEGGKLTLETANLEVGAGEPGVVPAVEPNRYVTLTVRDTGSSLDAGALARAFEPPPPDAEGSGRLALAEVYRLLQRCGGDLSVNVEPGRGTDFTVFLPLADARPAPAPASSPAPAPSPPSSS
jgi:Histidine kinase-, DNA gyrase B-, and HSP90-like ATPase/GAF domain